ncbi:MAG: response regulator [Rhodospirillaceae bacterium]|jgi:CheY-like chemotaxis protein|nr:response regulator [Rhodospirillaceae bacterium]MBT3932209.1 response regulator [Rhodospirillaceae bacterium]MBT4773718.1 response regulator [Rhodospirillaceae bacterium]MBT5357626.1 response regulator [Rhodospirillaceae bacterium]MBT5770615.1 response regulator [Rhodospirillaceae bacterium]
MIVDDNAHMRRLLRSILEALTVSQVREADNGVAALNDSKLLIPDVIITDMMMEPLNGLEFTRMLRDDPTHPATRVPVLMITGHSEKQHVESARDAGVTEFLAKPVTVKGVGARLNSLLANPRPFVRTQTFTGPDRRRREVPVEDDMRGSAVPSQSVTPLPRLTPPAQSPAQAASGPEVAPDPKRRALR